MFMDLHTIRITGELRELKSAVKFAMNYLMDTSVLTRKENPGTLVYQITSDGTYCVGCIFGDIQDKTYDGWIPFSFDYAPKLLAGVIKQHLKKQRPNAYLDLDADQYEYGFILKNYDDDMEDHRIQNEVYCGFTVNPKWLYYGK